MGWEYFWVWVITTIAAIALSPKPPKPRPAALEDFDLPTAEEGRPIPVVFGTVDITGANVLWYGDLDSTAIKKSSLFSSQTVGYKYYLGLHFGLCHGPVDAVTRIAVGDKEAWTGNVVASGPATVSAPSLFGGKKREGGIEAVVDFEFGGSAQAVNAYLDATIAGTLSAHRGILGAVCHNGDSTGGAYIGTSPYPKPWAFRVKRTTAGWYGGTAWYSAKCEVTGWHMNAAHILYECLTNATWGMGVDAAYINDAAWRAVADTLYTEGYGLSLMWNQTATIEDFCQTILDHIAGVLVFRLDTGQYELKLIRGDYSASSLPTHDESTVLAVKRRETRGWGETVNEFTLLYTDPDTFKDTSVTAHDLANIAIQGVIPGKLSLPGIRSHALAEEVVQRELASRATPLSVLQLEVNRSAWDTAQGDLFKFTWPKYGMTDVVFRVLKISKGTLEDGTITIDALQDIYSLGLGSYIVSSAAPSDPTEPATPADDNDAGASVLSTTTTGPPSGPADNDVYYVPTGATGAWSGHAGEIAVFDADTAEWAFETVSGSPVVYVADDAEYQTLVGDGTTDVVPWGPPGIPQNAQAGNYTISATDNDRHIHHASGAGSGDTYTIPANASVPLPIGFAFTITNLDSNAVTIAITSDTLYHSPTGTTGNRTLAQYGIATALKVTSTAWMIAGSGLT